MSGRREKVRIGVIGAGSISREYHLPAIVNNRRAELVALGNLNPGSLEAIGREFNVSTLYSDLNAMAADPNIDAVVNALPNYLHATVSISMLEGGKHVLCEKPMALAATEANAMVAAAQRSQRVLAIAYPWRFDEQMNWLRRVVKSGVLGKVFRIEAHSIVAGTGPAPSSWLRNRELAGGGALIDVGIHGLNSVSFLFEDRLQPQRVFAQCARHFGSGTTEDTATVMLDYDNTMTVVLRAGWQHPVGLYPHGTLEVFGVKGYARVFPCQLISDEPVVQEQLAVPQVRSGSHINSSMYEEQINGWLDSIQRGSAPRCSAQQGLRDMQVIDAAYRSAANSKAEEVG